jgi:hypothetical protein
MIAYMKEGITVTVNLNDIFKEIVSAYFPKDPFVYITHRVNSYAVDPAIYIETSKIKNLAGFAVVFESKFAINNVDIEKMFLSKPFEYFYDLDEAIAWSDKICSTY